MEMSLANPFASLRMHGGSNHLIMPTSLLQQAAAADEELGGGVVRVESCTSDFINALYPGESTANLSPRLRVMLTQSGHIGRQFAPSVRNALGEYAHRHVSSLVRWESTAVPANESLLEANGGCAQNQWYRSINRPRDSQIHATKRPVRTVHHHGARTAPDFTAGT